MQDFTKSANVVLTTIFILIMEVQSMPQVLPVGVAGDLENSFLRPLLTDSYVNCSAFCLVDLDCLGFTIFQIKEITEDDPIFWCRTDLNHRNEDLQKGRIVYTAILRDKLPKVVRNPPRTATKSKLRERRGREFKDDDPTNQSLDADLSPDGESEAVSEHLLKNPGPAQVTLEHTVPAHSPKNPQLTNVVTVPATTIGNQSHAEAGQGIINAVTSSTVSGSLLKNPELAQVTFEQTVPALFPSKPQLTNVITVPVTIIGNQSEIEAGHEHTTTAASLVTLTTPEPGDNKTSTPSTSTTSPLENPDLAQVTIEHTVPAVFEPLPSQENQMTTPKSAESTTQRTSAGTTALPTPSTIGSIFPDTLPESATVASIAESSTEPQPELRANITISIFATNLVVGSPATFTLSSTPQKLRDDVISSNMQTNVGIGTPQKPKKDVITPSQHKNEAVLKLAMKIVRPIAGANAIPDVGINVDEASQQGFPLPTKPSPPGRPSPPLLTKPATKGPTIQASGSPTTASLHGTLPQVETTSIPQIPETTNIPSQPEIPGATDIPSQSEVPATTGIASQSKVPGPVSISSQPGFHGTATVLSQSTVLGSNNILLRTPVLGTTNIPSQSMFSKTTKRSSIADVEATTYIPETEDYVDNFSPEGPMSQNLATNIPKPVNRIFIQQVIQAPLILPTASTLREKLPFVVTRIPTTSTIRTVELPFKTVNLGPLPPKSQILEGEEVETLGSTEIPMTESLDVATKINADPAWTRPPFRIRVAKSDNITHPEDTYSSLINIDPECAAFDTVQDRVGRDLKATTFASIEDEPVMITFVNQSECVGVFGKTGRKELRSISKLFPEFPYPEHHVLAGTYHNGVVFLFDDAQEQNVWRFQYDVPSKAFRQTQELMATEVYLQQVCGFQDSMLFKIRAILQLPNLEDSCILFDRSRNLLLSRNSSDDVKSLAKVIAATMETENVDHITSLFAWLDEPEISDVYVFGSNEQVYEIFRDNSTGFKWLDGAYRIVPQDDFL